MKAWCKCGKCEHQWEMQGAAISIGACPSCGQKGPRVVAGTMKPDWYKPAKFGLFARIRAALELKS